MYLCRVIKIILNFIIFAFSKFIRNLCSNETYLDNPLFLIYKKTV